MKFFKNAAIYRMTHDAINLDDMERMLDACRFTRCGSQDMAKTGWIPPMGEAFSDQLAHIYDGHVLLCVQREEKILPAPVINQALEAKIAKLKRPRRTV